MKPREGYESLEIGPVPLSRAGQTEKSSYMVTLYGAGPFDVLKGLRGIHNYQSCSL